jgi:outer membrane protein TolC
MDIASMALSMRSRLETPVKIKQSLLALSISAVSMFSIPAIADSSKPQEENIHSQNSTTRASLTHLIELALQNDASRKQYYAQSQSLRETGAASATLMDPKLKVGFGGLPVDSFKFDEDPMTNISVGLMQQFERGSTLKLQQQKSNQQADAIALQVENRELEVANAMTQLWLELGYLQIARDVLVQNKQLMEEMVSFIETNYAIGKSEAQDLLQAQLQVSKLEEKLQANQQQQNRVYSQLSEWLGDQWLNTHAQTTQASNQLDWSSVQTMLGGSESLTQHYEHLSTHPMVRISDASIAASQTQVDIAQEAYNPQFGVEVMYAYRQANNMMGEPASDLVSAYVTMDIPLFTGNRQDRSYTAAEYQVGAAKLQKDQLLAQMNAKVNALLVDKTNLAQRLDRYQTTLLTQASARTQAVERGYQNNTAQFNDVITAASDELALQLEQARIQTDLNIAYSNLAYLLNGFDYQVDTPEFNLNQAATPANHQPSSNRNSDTSE